MTIYEQLRRRWEEASIELADPATDEEIAALEERYSIRLPDDFKEYLKFAGGMKEGGVWDEEMISFAPVADLNEERRWDRIDPTRYELTFADFLIYSHWYVIEVSPRSFTSRVFLKNESGPQQLAATFEEFVELYLLDPEHIVYG